MISRRRLNTARLHAARNATRLFAAALLLAACGGNPVEPGAHQRPAGMTVSLGEQELVAVDADGNVTGELTVAAGAQTGLLSVAFLDADHEPLSLGGNFHLDVDVANAAIAAFEQSPAGAFAGRVRGNAAGTTSFVFRLMHGRVGRGHADWVSAPVPVVVTP